jgi:hypothetical protein
MAGTLVMLLDTVVAAVGWVSGADDCPAAMMA